MQHIINRGLFTAQFWFGMFWIQISCDTDFHRYTPQLWTTFIYGPKSDMYLIPSHVTLMRMLRLDKLFRSNDLFIAAKTGWISNTLYIVQYISQESRDIPCITCLARGHFGFRLWSWIMTGPAVHYLGVESMVSHSQCARSFLEFSLMTIRPVVHSCDATDLYMCMQGV